VVFLRQVTGGGGIGLSILKLLIVAGYLVIRLRHHFGRMEAEPGQPMNDSTMQGGKLAIISQ